MYQHNGGVLAYTGIAGGVLGLLLGTAFVLVLLGVVVCLLAMGPRIAFEPVREGERRRLRLTFNGRPFRRKK